MFTHVHTVNPCLVDKENGILKINDALTYFPHLTEEQVCDTIMYTSLSIHANNNGNCSNKGDLFVRRCTPILKTS